jgi:hypothetical protein
MTDTPTLCAQWAQTRALRGAEAPPAGFGEQKQSAFTGGDEGASEGLKNGRCDRGV